MLTKKGGGTVRLKRCVAEERGKTINLVAVEQRVFYFAQPLACRELLVALGQILGGLDFSRWDPGCLELLHGVLRILTGRPDSQRFIDNCSVLPSASDRR